MAHCFKSFDFAVLEDEKVFSDDELYPWERFAKWVWSIVVWCFSLLPFFSSTAKRPNPHLEEAESMKFAILGLDLLVDEDLRPWCLELNRSPTLNWEPRDPEGSQLKSEVIEDFAEMCIDPVLQAAARAAKDKPAWGSWGKLKAWAQNIAGVKSLKNHRGFIELPAPGKNAAIRGPGAVKEVLIANMHKHRQLAAEAAALLAKEYRTDPEDKHVYSLSELQEKYKEKYTPDAIEQYFKTECRLSAERPIKESPDAKSSETGVRNQAAPSVSEMKEPPPPAESDKAEVPVFSGVTACLLD